MAQAPAQTLSASQREIDNGDLGSRGRGKLKGISRIGGPFVEFVTTKHDFDQVNKSMLPLREVNKNDIVIFLARSRDKRDESCLDPEWMRLWSSLWEKSI